MRATTDDMLATFAGTCNEIIDVLWPRYMARLDGWKDEVRVDAAVGVDADVDADADAAERAGDAMVWGKNGFLAVWMGCVCV